MRLCFMRERRNLFAYSIVLENGRIFASHITIRENVLV